MVPLPIFYDQGGGNLFLIHPVEFNNLCQLTNWQDDFRGNVKLKTNASNFQIFNDNLSLTFSKPSFQKRYFSV